MKLITGRYRFVLVALSLWSPLALAGDFGKDPTGKSAASASNSASSSADTAALAFSKTTYALIPLAAPASDSLAHRYIVSCITDDAKVDFLHLSNIDPENPSTWRTERLLWWRGDIDAAKFSEISGRGYNPMNRAGQYTYHENLPDSSDGQYAGVKGVYVRRDGTESEIDFPKYDAEITTEMTEEQNYELARVVGWSSVSISPLTAAIVHNFRIFPLEDGTSFGSIDESRRYSRTRVRISGSTYTDQIRDFTEKWGHWGVDGTTPVLFGGAPTIKERRWYLRSATMFSAGGMGQDAFCIVGEAIVGPGGELITTHTLRNKIGAVVADLGEQGFKIRGGVPATSRNGHLAKRQTNGCIRYQYPSGKKDILPAAFGSRTGEGGVEVNDAGDLLIQNGDNATSDMLVRKFTDPVTQKIVWATRQFSDDALPQGWSGLQIHALANAQPLAKQRELEALTPSAYPPKPEDTPAPMLGGVAMKDGKQYPVLLLPVEVSRDRNNNLAWREKLDDWPEETSTSPPVTKPRSPKHLLAKEDNIRLRLPGLQGTPNVKVRVTSESDTSGVTLDLTEVNGGLENTGANKLRLADTSGSSTDAKTIKVVDEEVLRFTLTVNGRIYGEIANVMIDRAEFASGGAVFYTSTDGDRTVVRDKALTAYKFSDNGDLQLPDDSPGSRALAMSFLKNGGDNAPNSKQADIIHFASHGGGDGKLSDNANTLFDPSSDLGGGTTWNSDIEWVVLASCLQLNEAGGGKDAWKNWLDSTPRSAHGILGAYQPLSGNLQGEVESFWSRLNDEKVGPYLSIPHSYSLAMEAGGEPWAMIYHTQNQLDLLRVHQRDDNSTGTTYTYLTGIGGFNFVCGRDGDVSGKAAPIPVGDGLGTIRFNQAQVEKALPAMLDRIAVAESEVPVEKLGLGYRLHKSMKGNKIAIRNFDLSKSSGITLEDAEAISAKKVLESTEPNSRFKLEKRFVGKRERIDSRNGHDQKRTTGYLVNYVTTCDGIPIWDSYINFSICGDQIESVGMKLLKSTEMQNLTFIPASFKETFFGSLNSMKRRLKISKSYDILQAEICYKKDPTSPGTLVPTWHLLVNLSPERKFKELRHIWLSAKDGRCVDSQDKL